MIASFARYSWVTALFLLLAAWPVSAETLQPPSEPSEIVADPPLSPPDPPLPPPDPPHPPADMPADPPLPAPLPKALPQPPSAVSAAETEASKLKLSGYLQGRYEWHDDADFGLDPTTGRPRGSTRFLVRRARLKAFYQGQNSEYVLQLASNRSEPLTITDAEATFVDTWTPLGIRLTVGQFLVPFGFEILQSSSQRELPERALFVRTLFLGERDRGLRLRAGYGPLTFQTALINGTGIQDPIYGSFDQTSFKDLVGRLGLNFNFVSGGLSAYWGHSLRTRLGRAASATLPETPTRYERFERLRLGADVQFRMELPVVGATVLRGELTFAHDDNMSFSGALADPCKDVQSLGWSATLVQDLGSHVALIGRVDQFDPNGGLEQTCTAYAPARTDRVTTIGSGFLFHISSNLRGTVVYEHLDEQASAEIANDSFTAQLQTKF